MSDATLILGGTTSLAGPLLFVGLGELIAERAGTINLSVEGMMLGSAVGAAMISDISGSSLLAVVGGIVCGWLIAMAQAVLSHRLTLNQFVVGIALNIFVLGLTSYLLDIQQYVPQSIGKVALVGLSDIPLVGKPFFDQCPFFYGLFLLIPYVWWLLWRSRWGLEIQAAGENPEAASTSGVAVNHRRRQAIGACGLCAGFGGAYLSLGVVGSVSPNMTAGTGYIAIAAVIFGVWTVKGTVAGCLLFGAAEALQLTLPAIGLALNSQLLTAAPYVLAIIAMAFFAGRKRGPASLGITFEPIT